MRRRSERREAEKPVRDALVAEILAERWLCEARLWWCCNHMSAEVNEICRGAGRAATYLDKTKVTALCKACHRWLTVHPKWARHHGHQVPHEVADREAAFAVAATVREALAALARSGQRCCEDCEIDHREAA